MTWIERQAALNRERPTGIEVFIHNLLDREGLSFTFQKPLLGKYIADFFLEPNIVIEVDGPHHASQTAKDKARQDDLESHGFKVLRLTYRRLNFGGSYSSDYSDTWGKIKDFLRTIGAREASWDPSYDRTIQAIQRNRGEKI